MPDSNATVQLTIWMNTPSFYQSDLFRALVARVDVDLKVIFAHPLPAARAALGWQQSVAGFESCQLQPGVARWLDVLTICFRQRRRFHIVNGVWAEPAFSSAIALLALFGSSYAVYAEAPDPYVQRSALKMRLRELLGRLLLLRSRGVLGVAEVGCRFYRRLLPKNGLSYVFGYFRAAEPLPDQPRSTAETQPIRILFIGQIIERKGLDLLLHAVAPLLAGAPRAFSIAIVGDGECRTQLKELARTLFISGQVSFEGVITSPGIPARIAAADLLVLPSRWDGWGLVVNEALSAGVPVLVSDACGAADLIGDGENGYRFESDNIADLRSKLVLFQKRAAAGLRFDYEVRATAETITPNAAAGYLLTCINHMVGQEAELPTPPWARRSTRSPDRRVASVRSAP